MMNWGNSWCGFGGIGLGRMGFGGITPFLGTFLGLLLLGALVLVAALVIWALRRSQAMTTPLQPRNDVTPMEIARRRLASGEITMDEFDRVRAALGS